jgi:Protein of unknown function (DUF2889)
MPLSPAVPREHIHTRTVECRGYRRADGLWDIEGHLTDVKTYPFTNEHRGEVAAGDPVHDMWLRLTIDDTLTIREIEAVTDKSPFRVCPSITGNFQRLNGLQLKPGFNGKARQLLGGTEGCTHLVDMLAPLATTAFQTIFPLRDRDRRARRAGQAANGEAKPRKRPHILDTCHALRSDGEVVREVWPEFYTGA